MTGTVLVAGASGLVGTAAVEKFLADGWDVVAVSRRPPEVDHERPFRHVAVDLRDTDASQAAFRELTDVTHVVYAAVYEKPGLVAGWREPRPDGDEPADAAEPDGSAERGIGGPRSHQPAAGHQGLRRPRPSDRDPGSRTLSP